MANIPTELLRTLVTVVDLRSFTKAAHSLGITQPAVSAQVKRLQLLLGSEILDKSQPGVVLTATGERVVGQARRLLSINDDILDLAMPRPASQTIRLGVPGEFVTPFLPWSLAEFRTRWPNVRFNVRNEYHEPIMRELRQGNLDLCISFSTSALHDARHQWTEDLVWVRSATQLFDVNVPVSLVTFGETCVLHRAMIDSLLRAGRDYEVVYNGSSMASLAAAVSAGMGVMALTRSRVGASGLVIWDDAPLPKLPHVYCGIFIREGPEQATLEQLADSIAGALNPALHPGLQEPNKPPVGFF